MPDFNGSAEVQGAGTQAPTELNHPMYYTDSAFRELRPANAEERQAYMYDRRMLEDLINEYNYRVDASLANTANYRALNKLFADDADITLPRGKYNGNTGLGQWLLSPVSVYHRMSHLSSNHSIRFESNTIGHGRSTWQSSAGFHPTDIGQVFFTGGYYYWSFRKIGEEWKISFLFLEMTWTSGEFPGTPAK